MKESSQKQQRQQQQQSSSSSSSCCLSLFRYENHDDDDDDDDDGGRQPTSSTTNKQNSRHQHQHHQHRRRRDVDVDVDDDINHSRCDRRWKKAEAVLRVLLFLVGAAAVITSVVAVVVDAFGVCRHYIPIIKNNSNLNLRATATATEWQEPEPPPMRHQQQQQLRLRFLQEVEVEDDQQQQQQQQQLQCNKTCCTELWDEECVTPEENPFAAVPFAVQIILIIVLICLSALFSGLTLGLMGLDKTGLEIVMQGDDVVNAEYARRIYPLRKNGNLLLCTLLLGNVAVNALLSILLADRAGGLVGFLASTIIIVIFGEILPQAICARHALRIGSAVIPLMKVIVVLFFPIAYPLSWCLNKMLGKELATTYSNAEMMQLLQIHVQEKVLDQDTAITMKGALQYKDKTVSEVMTPLSNTFMLSMDEKLSFETVAKIFKTGYSRIPVYEIDKNNVIGLLFVKDLIFIDPEKDTRVADFVEIFGRSLHVVWVDDKLGDVLRDLKQGRSHMALVRDVNTDDTTVDPYYELKGIITLEDIIEEILGDQIVDETDTYADNLQSIRVDRGDSETFRWDCLRLLDSKIVDQTLSFDESRAVAAHLSKNYPHVVSLLTERQLRKLVSETPVKLLPTAEQIVGQVLPTPDSQQLLYEKDVQCDFATLILNGKVTVISGIDQFRSDVSSWSLLGTGALTDTNYAPDFSAFVSTGPCRCIQLKRHRFSVAVDASALERHSHHGGNGTCSATAATNSNSKSDPSIAAAPPSPPPSQSTATNSDETGKSLKAPPAATIEGDENSNMSRNERLIAALQAVGTPAAIAKKKKKGNTVLGGGTVATTTATPTGGGSQHGGNNNINNSTSSVPTSTSAGPSSPAVSRRNSRVLTAAAAAADGGVGAIVSTTSTTSAADDSTTTAAASDNAPTTSALTTATPTATRPAAAPMTATAADSRTPSITPEEK